MGKMQFARDRSRDLVIVRQAYENSPLAKA
jgi:hypothetical protein